MLTIKEAKKKLETKEISAVELTELFLKKIEEKKEINAYITVTAELAREQAKQADNNIRNGTARCLEGIPLGIKDLFCTKDVLTTAGSKILSNFVAPYESTVTKKLFEQGAVMLGKCNLDEFAMGSSNITSHFGAVINPWSKDKKLVPGGSSGGSAAAVAAGLALGTTGTDTGGSIRQPAAFCGIAGIKPTYGLCSRFGVIAFASSLDCPGPMAATVEDTAIMLEVMAGFDPNDSQSLNVKIPNYSQDIIPTVKNKKIAVIKDVMSKITGDSKVMMEQAIKKLTEGGAIIEEIDFPMLDYALAIYYVIAPAEASSNLARYDGVRYGHRSEHSNTLEEMYMNTRSEGFGDEVKRRIMIGTYVLSSSQYDAYYLRAQKARQLLKNYFNDIFGRYDLILTPTTPTEAFGINDKNSCPEEMYLNDVYTVTVNLAGLPAISVPYMLSENGLPLGIQFIGPQLSEQKLFNAGKYIEDVVNFPRLIA